MGSKNQDMNRTYLEKLGYAERIPSWVIACREIVEGERAEKEHECEAPA